MCLITEVCFYSGQRKNLPQKGYRPDIVVDNKQTEYWGISFTELDISDFDTPTYAKAKFTFQESHYNEIHIDQKFRIMEGPREVGNGKILSIIQEE